VQLGIHRCHPRTGVSEDSLNNVLRDSGVDQPGSQRYLYWI